MSNDKRKQQEKNLDTLAPLTDMGANGRFIQKQDQWRFKLRQMVAGFVRRLKRDTAKAESNAELFMDDWLFQHGKTEATLTPAERINLMNDTMARVVEQHSARKSGDDGDGPLGEFERNEPIMG
jgi:hypothetical protein